MPEIARFYGIVITMYASDHASPHLHARHGGDKATFNIRTGLIDKGRLPHASARLVATWIQQHREELLKMWDVVQEKKSGWKLPPLD